MLCNTYYVVYNGQDEVMDSFDLLDDAFDYAKGSDNGVADKTYVRAIDVCTDDWGATVEDDSEDNRRIVWSWDQEQVEEPIVEEELDDTEIDLSDALNLDFDDEEDLTEANNVVRNGGYTIEDNSKGKCQDNAVVDCPVHDIIAHCEDDKPIDCKMKKPALEKPVAGDPVNVKVNQGLTEDKDVDYVDYKHSYCHELEPKMKQLNYLCNVQKKPVADIVKKVLGILKAAKDINKTKKEQWFYDTIKTKKWNTSAEIYQFIKNSIKKAKDVEVKVDDKGELKKESLKEAKKDEDKLPPDPEAVKLEVHNNLNNLVASEITTIDEYENAKSEIIDAPIEHKDELISTLDHIKDEEKEHIDELISATSEIPFAKTVSDTPIAEPAIEEYEDEVEESLKEEEDKKDENSYSDKVRAVSDRTVRMRDCYMIKSTEKSPAGKEFKVFIKPLLKTIEGDINGTNKVFIGAAKDFTDYICYFNSELKAKAFINRLNTRKIANATDLKVVPVKDIIRDISFKGTKSISVGTECGPVFINTFKLNKALQESLTGDSNLINTKVADVEYNDDDGYDRHVLIYLGNEDKTEEEIEDDLTEEGMMYVFVNDIFEKEIPAKNYGLYDVIESYDVPDGEGVSYTIGGEDDDEWDDEDELTEYLVNGLKEAKKVNEALTPEETDMINKIDQKIAELDGSEEVTESLNPDEIRVIDEIDAKLAELEQDAESIDEGFLDEVGTTQGIDGYKVNNVPAYAANYNYIVARYDSKSDSLWFWGAFDNEAKAKDVAEEIGGQVIYRHGYNIDHQNESLTESPTEDRIEEIKIIAKQRPLTDDEIKEFAELIRIKNS